MVREKVIIALTLFLSATQMMTVAAESDEVVVVIGEDASAELSEEIVQDLDENTDVLDYEALYGSVLDGIIEDGVYALCDIDDDGTKEMIVGYGSTADYVNMVWTVDADGALDFAGIFNLPQTFYAAPDNNGIYGVYGHMGHEIITRITITNGIIVEETVSDIESVEDYYSNDMLIATYDVSDRSGLQQGSSLSDQENGTVNIYGLYRYDNGIDNVMTADIGFNSGDEGGDYLYLEALSYGDRYTVIFSGLLTDEGNNTYRAEPYDDEMNVILELEISSLGMQVSVIQADSDSWMVLEGYYDKTYDLDVNGVS